MRRRAWPSSPSWSRIAPRLLLTTAWRYLCPEATKIGQALLQPAPRLAVPALVEQHRAQLDEHGALALEVVVGPVGGARLLEQGDRLGELALVVGDDRQVAQALADQPGLVGRAGLGQRLVQHVLGLGMGALPGQAAPPPQQGVGLEVDHAGRRGPARPPPGPGSPARRTRCGGSASSPSAAAAGPAAGRRAARRSSVQRVEVAALGVPVAHPVEHALAGQDDVEAQRRLGVGHELDRPVEQPRWPRPGRGPTTPAGRPGGTSGRPPPRRRCWS